MRSARLTAQGLGQAFGKEIATRRARSQAVTCIIGLQRWSDGYSVLASGRSVQHYLCPTDRDEHHRES